MKEFDVGDRVSVRVSPGTAALAGRSGRVDLVDRLADGGPVVCYVVYFDDGAAHSSRLEWAILPVIRYDPRLRTE